MEELQRLQVFYDGACRFCRAHVQQFRRHDIRHRIHWIDIAQPSFDARKYGLDLQRLNESIHVRTPDGRVYTAVPAFVKIWQALPERPLTTMAQWVLRLPGAVPLAGIVYRLFAKNRYRLTGRCTPETCRI